LHRENQINYLFSTFKSILLLVRVLTLKKKKKKKKFCLLSHFSMPAATLSCFFFVQPCFFFVLLAPLHFFDLPLPFFFFFVQATGGVLRPPPRNCEASLSFLIHQQFCVIRFEFVRPLPRTHSPVTVIQKSRFPASVSLSPVSVRF
jgi:hypothetical protein